MTKFTVRNLGMRTVNVQWMEFSQKGLIAQMNPVIGPGSSVEVVAQLNTSDLQGEIAGNVVLGLDDPRTPRIILTLRGFVIGAPSDGYE